jgi:hypothetical protein
MRSPHYLNVILTVLALLLTVQLWTTLTGAGVSVTTAQAGPVTAGSGGGIPDAGAQRKEMIDLLKATNQKLDALTELFKSGGARVHMEVAADKGK